MAFEPLHHGLPRGSGSMGTGHVPAYLCPLHHNGIGVAAAPKKTRLHPMGVEWESDSGLLLLFGWLVGWFGIFFVNLNGKSVSLRIGAELLSKEGVAGRGTLRSRQPASKGRRQARDRLRET